MRKVIFFAYFHSEVEGKLSGHDRMQIVEFPTNTAGRFDNNTCIQDFFEWIETMRGAIESLTGKKCVMINCKIIH